MPFYKSQVCPLTNTGCSVSDIWQDGVRLVVTLGPSATQGYTQGKRIKIACRNNDLKYKPLMCPYVSNVFGK